MNKFQNIRSILLSMFITGMLTFSLSFNVFAQDSVQSGSKKGMVVLKIKKDDHGKTTVIDTTFTIATPFDQKELEEYLKKYEEASDNLGKEFDYEFDVPCPPDVPPPFPGNDGLDGEYWPGHEMRVFRHENKRQTLSDLIGDIPMDRVKSYSIKDRKNGKRIIIDIGDAPLIENQDRVIIIREPGRPPRKRDHSDRQMKVIIESDDGKQIEK